MPPGLLEGLAGVLNAAGVKGWGLGSSPALLVAGRGLPSAPSRCQTP
jgi:hypothetical protein